MALSDERILGILASGVYMDLSALNCLHELGCGDLTGFAVDRVIDEDCIEAFSDHPLNGAFSGRRRDGRQSFWECPAGVLTPLAEESQTLARMIDYSGRELASCCMGVFENRLGGRVCVSGYYPWIFLQNLSKSSQVKSLVRWLSKDTLPAYVSSFHKTNIWAVEPRQGALSVAITSSSLDAAEDLVLTLRTAGNEVSVFDMRCQETQVASRAKDGPYAKFVLPRVGAWEMVLVIAR
jgi:hypothetical protein